jgi:beta-1,4-mannosyl-glycoprotein beta-1,4-N-acetylglucosaminyltransferase
MKIYDCFPFFNENDLLELRINQHWDYFDKFIIVEAGETHTGLKKPFNFDHERFKKYKSKIIYRNFDCFQEEINKFPGLLDAYSLSDRTAAGQHTSDWVRDHFQGNYFVKVLSDLDAHDHDIVYASSVDEVLNEEGFKKGLAVFTENKDKLFSLKRGGSPVVGPNDAPIKSRPTFGFILDLYVYKYNLFHKSIPVAQMTEFGVHKNILPSTMRGLSLGTHINIQDAGWHFTYLDNAGGERVLEKQKSWAHSRDRLPNQRVKFLNTTKEQALQRMFQDYDVKKVNITRNTHPKYLIENLEKYKDYIL